jgi:hypothetical protein
MSYCVFLVARHIPSSPNQEVNFGSRFTISVLDLINAKQSQSTICKTQSFWYYLNDVQRCFRTWSKIAYIWRLTSWSSHFTEAERIYTFSLLDFNQTKHIENLNLHSSDFRQYYTSSIQSIYSCYFQIHSKCSMLTATMKQPIHIHHIIIWC